MRRRLAFWFLLASALGAFIGAATLLFWGSIREAIPPGPGLRLIEAVLRLVEKLARRVADTFIGFQSHESPEFILYLLVFFAFVGAVTAVSLVFCLTVFSKLRTPERRREHV